MPLSVKERILAIRLIDKVKANPATAEKLGIVIVDNSRNPSIAGSDFDKS